VEQIVVGVADCGVGAVPGEELVTYALGSCIGLAVYDPVALVGGLLHFMLPDSTIDSARGRENPCMFADTGIPLLLARVNELGAGKRRLLVHAVGGAQLMDEDGVFEIGKRNYLAMRKILWKHGLLLHGEAVGGVNSRTVHLEIGTGRLWVQEAGVRREMVAPSPRKGAVAWPIGS
jgi:chemotaxis protein CheD